MIEILRLIRLSLVLRLIPTILLAVAVSNGSLRVPIEVVMLGVVPSMIILLLTFVFERPLARRIRLVLAASMIANAIELGIALEASGATQVRYAPTMIVPALFQIFPLMIGAWLEGRPRWRFWWVGGIAINALILVPLATFTPTIASLLTSGGIGPLVAQAITSGVIGFFVASLADSERSKQRALEAANKRLAEQAQVAEELAISRERVRLARDLHDTMAHSLAALVVQLQAAEVVADGAPDELREQLANARDTARHGLREARAAIDNLRQSSAADLGLAAALDQYTAGLRAPTSFSHSVEPGAKPIERSVAAAAFEIAREAVENAHRHARAASVQVKLTEKPDQLVLETCDDGVGFDHGDIPESRHGLRGMRERAELAGGRLMITSSPARGTRIVFTHPAA